MRSPELDLLYPVFRGKLLKKLGSLDIKSGRKYVMLPAYVPAEMVCYRQIRYPAEMLCFELTYTPY